MSGYLPASNWWHPLSFRKVNCNSQSRFPNCTEDVIRWFVNGNNLPKPWTGSNIFSRFQFLEQVWLGALTNPPSWIMQKIHTQIQSSWVLKGLIWLDVYLYRKALPQWPWINFTWQVVTKHFESIPESKQSSVSRRNPLTLKHVGSVFPAQ